MRKNKLFVIILIALILLISLVIILVSLSKNNSEEEVVNYDKLYSIIKNEDYKSLLSDPDLAVAYINGIEITIVDYIIEDIPLRYNNDKNLDDKEITRAALKNAAIKKLLIKECSDNNISIDEKVVYDILNEKCQNISPEDKSYFSSLGLSSDEYNSLFTKRIIEYALYEKEYALFISKDIEPGESYQSINEIMEEKFAEGELIINS